MGGLGGLTLRESVRYCAMSLPVTLGLLLVVSLPMAALESAGGGAKGKSGFQRTITYIDNVFSDAVLVVLALAPFALLVGAVKHFAGDDDANKWLVGTAFGVGIALTAKAITA